MRLTLAAAFLLSTTAFAQRATCTSPSAWSACEGAVPFPFVFHFMPRGAGAPTVEAPPFITDVAPWTLVGEGYELKSDELATGYRATLLRSGGPGRAGPSGALLHRESAIPWRGVTVVLRANLRAGMVTGGARLVLSTEDASGKVLASSTSGPLSGTTLYRWERVEVLVSEAAARLVAKVELEGSGSLYVRELRLDDAELLASR
jgi:hypothetical protein